MENEPRESKHLRMDAEVDPFALDPEGANIRVSQLREVQQKRGDDSALSVDLGEAVVTVEVKQPEDA